MHGIVNEVDYDIVGKKHSTLENEQIPSSMSSDFTYSSDLLCLNLKLANAELGDIIQRSKRTSLTFRHKIPL